MSGNEDDNFYANNPLHKNKIITEAETINVDAIETDNNNQNINVEAETIEVDKIETDNNNKTSTTFKSVVNKVIGNIEKEKLTEDVVKFPKTGPITKQWGNEEYFPLFKEQVATLEKLELEWLVLFNELFRIKCGTTDLTNVFQKKEDKIATKNMSSTPLSALQIFLLYFKQNYIPEVVSNFYESFVYICPSCISNYLPFHSVGFSEEQKKNQKKSENSIHTLLRLNYVGFIVTTLLDILPLLFMTLYTLWGGRGFSGDNFAVETTYAFDEVSQPVNTDTPSSSLTPEDFSEFSYGSLAIYKNDNIPYFPAAPIKDCVYSCVWYPNSPPATAITHPVYGESCEQTFYTSPYIFQLITYIMVLCFSIKMIINERTEMKFQNLALSLNGLFIPISDRKKLSVEKKTLFNNDYTILFSEKIDQYFCFIASCFYLFPLLFIGENTSTWYIFPTKDEAIDFNANYNVATNYYEELEFPQKFVYISLADSGAFNFANIFQGILFFKGIWAIRESQIQLFDWIDTEVILDMDNEEDCIYFDIHKNRSRVFNELILQDYRMEKIFYPIISNLKYTEDDVENGNGKKYDIFRYDAFSKENTINGVKSQKLIKFEKKVDKLKIDFQKLCEEVSNIIALQKLPANERFAFEKKQINEQVLSNVRASLSRQSSKL